MSRIMLFSDVHAPAHLEAAVEQLIDENKGRVDEVAILGDLVDFQAISRYVHNPDLPSIKDEIGRAKEVIRKLSEAFPNVWVLKGNHEFRLDKSAMNGGLSSQILKPLPEILEFPDGWKLCGRYKWFGPFCCRHGTTRGRGFSGWDAAIKTAQRSRRSTVMGHVHHAGYARLLAGEFDSIWACACGCLLNPLHPAFGYAIDMVERPALGYILIENWIPRWVPIQNVEYVNLNQEELADFMDAELQRQQQSCEQMTRSLAGFEKTMKGTKNTLADALG
jgi:predicted phosphodiesterase